MLIVPGQAGEIGVLARHAPLVATLKAGSTRVHLGGNEILEFATGPGFFKVETDRALALVDDAVNVREIDDARAHGAARGGPGRAREARRRHGLRRPLAARAAHPPRREPARRLRPHDRLSDAARAPTAAGASPAASGCGAGRSLSPDSASRSRAAATSSSSVAIRSSELAGVSPPASTVGMSRGGSDVLRLARASAEPRRARR